MTTILERYGTVLRCYDNGGKTADRYTLIPPRWATSSRERDDPRLFLALSASASPFHQQGVGMHVAAFPGRHLGRRVHWAQLPADVQKLARSNFPEFTGGTA